MRPREWRPPSTRSTGGNPDVHGERGLHPPGFPHRQLLVGRHRRQHGERDHDPCDQRRPGQAVDDADHLAGEPGRDEQLVQAVERHLHPGRDRRHLGRREPLLHHRRRRPADLLRHRHHLHPGRPHRHLLVRRRRRQHRDHQHHPHQARQRQAGNDADHLRRRAPTATNNWFQQSSVTFTLGASDASSGTATTLYTVDGGAQQTYSGTVTVSGQGDHTVTYWSVDNAGNTETTNTTHIKLDNVKPATTLTTSPASPDGTNNWFKQSSVTFTLAATDATSGVANRFYTVDGGAQQTYSGTVTVSGPGRPHRHLLVGRQRRQHRDHQHHPHQARQRRAHQLARADQQDRRLVRERKHDLLPRRSRRLLLDPEHRRGRHLRCGLEQLPRARRNGHRLDAHRAGR